MGAEIMRQVYCAVGHKHYEDEECPQCVVADDPVAVWENPDQHTKEAKEAIFELF